MNNEINHINVTILWLLLIMIGTPGNDDDSNKSFNFSIFFLRLYCYIFSIFFYLI